jgi:hypothetical protein
MSASRGGQRRPPDRHLVFGKKEAALIFCKAFLGQNLIEPVARTDPKFTKIVILSIAVNLACSRGITLVL